jgi:hypothetical protein
MMKYKDDELVEMLTKEKFWVGQTKEQLIDSLGEPLAVDQKVLKTKVKEVWKYEQTGKNRYGLKITLDDGVVVEGSRSKGGAAIARNSVPENNGACPVGFRKKILTAINLTIRM